MTMFAYKPQQETGVIEYEGTKFYVTFTYGKGNSDYSVEVTADDDQIKLIEGVFDDGRGWHFKVAGGLHDAYNWYTSFPDPEDRDHEPMPEYLDEHAKAYIQDIQMWLCRIFFDMLKEQNFEKVFGKDLYDKVYAK